MSIVKVPRNQVARVVETLLECPDLKQASVFLSPDTCIKATRIYKYDGRKGNEDIRLTIGKPNYLARRFVKACQKAGEPFPIRKVQLKWWPRKRGEK